MSLPQKHLLADHSDDVFRARLRGREDQPSDRLCPLCTERYHLKQERTFNEQLEREWAHAESPLALDEARREQEMMWQCNSRLCRKYGLRGRRERGRSK